MWNAYSSSLEFFFFINNILTWSIIIPELSSFSCMKNPSATVVLFLCTKTYYKPDIGLPGYLRSLLQYPACSFHTDDLKIEISWIIISRSTPLRVYYDFYCLTTHPQSSANFQFIALKMIHTYNKIVIYNIITALTIIIPTLDRLWQSTYFRKCQIKWGCGTTDGWNQP